jgi:hypothetical protein
VPATSVNALVAAWLQWMIRDWFSHGRSPTDNPWRIPMADDDPWPRPPMLILRTRPDPTRPPGPVTCRPPTPTPRRPGGTAPRSTARRRSSSGSRAAASTASYGSAQTAGAAADRPGAQPGHGPGLLARAGHAPDPVHPGAQRGLRPAAGRVPVVVRRRPVREGPAGQRGPHRQDPHDRVDTGGDQPPDDPDRAAGNWWGLAGERLHKLFGRLSDSEIVSGIPGSQTQPQHYGVPYSLTEEFVAVYRSTRWSPTTTTSAASPTTTASSGCPFAISRGRRPSRS